MDHGFYRRLESTAQEPATQRTFLDNKQLEEERIQECKISRKGKGPKKDLENKCAALEMQKACKKLAKQDKKKKNAKKGCGKGGKDNDAELKKKCDELAKILCEKVAKKKKEAALIKKCAKIAQEEMCQKLAKKGKRKGYIENETKRG